MGIRGRPMLFLGVVTALSIPFFVLGAVTGGLRVGAMRLPSSAFMFVLPVLVAVALTWRADGRAAAVTLLSRVVDRPAAKPSRYVLAALLIPAIGVLSYLLPRWSGRVDGALPLSPAAAPAVIVAYLLAATCEELGWTGYATDPLRQRFGLAATGIGLGVYWALWHLIPLLQAGHPAAWLAGWFLTTVAARVLIVWLHDHTGNGVSAAILLHAAVNTTESYTPGLDLPITMITIGILTAAAAAAALARP
ncbi:CPBP family intramembrane metalloprotease [Nocardia sp. ET3-3]|uniref:CPBP family intramembrane metalloprotease n=1 Tax=Nocardia terrae TaxID=2675851 RepID=A0A7K1VAW9_9NOCA|nr:CPBP family intramembrane glutamic endopeptidase [Nocardia terrae]MVU83785.1 CPBP family intramembrane metalloprotease [Nocardia terrae]